MTTWHVPYENRRPGSCVYIRSQHGRICLDVRTYVVHDPCVLNNWTIRGHPLQQAQATHTNNLSNNLVDEQSSSEDGSQDTASMSVSEQASLDDFDFDIDSPIFAEDLLSPLSSYVQFPNSLLHQRPAHAGRESASKRFHLERLSFGRAREETLSTKYDIYYQVNRTSDIWSKCWFDFVKRNVHICFVHSWTLPDGSRPIREYRVIFSFSDIAGPIGQHESQYHLSLMFKLKLKGRPICSFLPAHQPEQANASNHRTKRGMTTSVHNGSNFRHVTRQNKDVTDRWARSFGVPERCPAELNPAEGLRSIEEICRTAGPVQLYEPDRALDIGRIQCIEISWRLSKKSIDQFDRIRAELQEQNIECQDMEKRVERELIALTTQRLWWVELRHGHTSDSLSFEIRWLLEVALSGGLIDERFIYSVLQYLISEEPALIKYALKQVVLGNKQLVDPVYQLRHIVSNNRLSTLNVDELPPYCCYLRRAIVTVSGIQLLSPHVEMTNRITRQYSSHLDRFIRIQFLDEVGHGHLYSAALDPTSYPYERIFRTLFQGIHVAGRHYELLAFGSSQLREHAVFAFASCRGEQDCGNPGCDGVSAMDIRSAIGTVDKIKIVAKHAARLGQAFSTTRTVKKGLQVKTRSISDWIGGRNDAYCFSDGVGMTSANVLRAIGGEWKIVGEHPSAVQFRMGGAKGVLQYQPENSILPGQLPIRDNTIAVRDTQAKFESKHNQLEVVRIAKYGTAFLNRQYVVVLWSLGIESSVFLDMQAKEIARLEQSLVDERVALECLRKHVDEHSRTDILSDLVNHGFMARGDPFVLEVLRLFRTWRLKELKERARILINDGCFLMGVCDETGQLHGHYDSMYEQDDSALELMDLPEVFVQISQPSEAGKYRIIEGVCLIGRAPSLHPGDMRLVRAVNLPSLRHLHDVLVFPTNGDQDLPSMCSGGDLDGDDYTVIWDHRLFPAPGKRYERPMNYDGPPPLIVDKVTIGCIINFVLNFFSNDRLGKIANQHMATAHDNCHAQPGKNRSSRAYHPDCLRLANLHSIAVDFAKTGIPVTPEEMPPERKVWPDFMEKPYQSFESDSPLSLMYRQIKPEMAQDRQGTVSYGRIIPDVPGMHEWIDLVKTKKKLYDHSVRQLMAEYGIRSEAEVVTGFILTYDDVYSSKREFQMRGDVAEKYGIIRDAMRHDLDSKARKDSDGRALSSVAAQRRLEGMAAAMYHLTFDEIEKTGTQVIMLSFPWLFHEVLGQLVRRDQSNGTQDPASII